MDKIKQLLENLRKRGIEAKFFETRDDIKKDILNEVDENDLVAIGGSMSIQEIDIYDNLVNKSKEVLWHWKVEPDKRMDLLKKAIFSDVYLSSTNAILEDGRIINIDGVGNRVASMFFGPKKVILVCGINKICKDYNDAMNRIKTSACPNNARRLNLNTPCAKIDSCIDCKNEQRMCMVTSIIEKKPPTIDFKVYILNEEIGY
ncbi:lactate utilization protein [Tepidibacter mesophilus]|uniref:lactate utilization protein n=1 Tax=Tepidibacter mesophilus TaxID=655607 RepID=UPI000C06A02D|nr:lactate utilization protein [Tepidibacter mesophilus]